MSRNEPASAALLIASQQISGIMASTFRVAGASTVTIMRTIDFPTDRLTDFRSAIPVGVEHYVIAGAARTYVNIRTADDQLVNRIEAVLRVAPAPF